MASTYVNDLRLNEMATGDESGNWGVVTNLNLELVGEALGYGTDALSINGTTITATATELNYTDGVTSAIQTQLDTKATTGKAIAMALVFG